MLFLLSSLQSFFFFNFWPRWVFVVAYRLSLVVVLGLLIVVASLVEEPRL